MSVGAGRAVAAALATLGCCLLTAPVANADFEDLLDPLFGAASAGPDLGDVGTVDLPGVTDVNSVLNDPLAQLEQLFHDSPGQSGADEHATTPADTSHDDTTGSEHSNSDSNSGNSSSVPKLSMPSGGSGGGGNAGGGGNSGNPGNPAAKTKTNTSRPAGTEGAAHGETPVLP